MKRKLTFASILFSAITILLLAPAAYGDSLTFTLLDPDQYASQGQATTLSFYTTVSAPNTNTGIEYINGDEFTASSPTTLNDFNLDNVPFFLDPGQSSTDLLFTIFLPANISFGDYSGIFSLYGGSTVSSDDKLAQVSYNISITPEPSSFVLLVTGIALPIVALWYRRHPRNTSLTV